MNFRKSKRNRTIAAVIVIILVASMVLSVILSAFI